MATRIPAIEDDADLRALLRMILEDEDFDVVEAGSGEQGLELADESIDLVLLDIKLPDIGGFEVCRRLRADSGLPIVMVTAQVDSYDMVAGLSAGADAYVTKPFIPKVLVARIRALLRRVQASSDTTGRMVCGDLEISPREGFAARGGVQLQLTKTEFRLLCDLAEHQGRVFLARAPAPACVGIRLRRRRPTGRLARSPSENEGRSRSSKPHEDRHHEGPRLQVRLQ